MISDVYFITGVSGLIGSSIVKRIITSEDYLNGKILIVGVTRDKKRTLDFYSGYNCNFFEIIEADILQLTECINALKSRELCPDYIIHCAAPTKSSYMISNPVETVDSIVNGTRNMLELAKMYNSKSMVYLSSMEVYGRINCDSDKRVQENELGKLSLFDVRSCYPLGKRMAENLCYLYYKEYNVPVKIARLAQVFGKGILPGENRVFAQFANAVRKKQNIVLHTSGNSTGNYCDIDDAVNAIMLLLDKGSNGEAYNVVNEMNTMTIRQMADLVVGEVAEGSISVEYDIPKENQYGYAADTGLRMSSAKIEALGFKPIKNLKEMYIDMIQYMNENNYLPK